MHVECLTFAISLTRQIISEQYDIVHTIDAPLTKLLFHFRNTFGLKFKILHTEGTAVDPEDYTPSDYIHHMSKDTYDRSLEFGFKSDIQELIPLGIQTDRFKSKATKSELRIKHGIPEDKFVILCVAALNRYHKRIDYLIDEFETLDENCFLLLDGSLDHGDPDLKDIALNRFGNRCKVGCVPTNDVGELYQMADLKVLPSLYEAFALVVPEALSTGLPVIVHDNPHFNWLVNQKSNLLDMSKPGNLSRRIKELQSNPGALTQLVSSNSTKERWDWNHLKSQYQKLYENTLETPFLKTKKEMFNP